MDWPPKQKEVERVKFLRQMELSLREEVRRKNIEIQDLKRKDSFARYVLQFFDETTQNK